MNREGHKDLQKYLTGPEARFWLTGQIPQGGDVRYLTITDVLPVGTNSNPTDLLNHLDAGGYMASEGVEKRLDTPALRLIGNVCVQNAGSAVEVKYMFEDTNRPQQENQTEHRH